MPSQVSACNHGSGAQNAATGSGNQNNNAGGMQFNNNNFFGFNPQEPQVDENEACLHSLCFPNIDARQKDIIPAQKGTCDWLFSTAEFKKWRDRTDLPAHNGVLWIKGKPGVGKSTLMKHTLRHCQNDKAFRDHLIVSYFFNARGGILEKTPLGMLRSIVYQLLDKDATLYDHFVPIFREKRRIYKGGDFQWPQRELEEFVRTVVEQPRSKPLLLLVDALDECGEQDVRDVVGFLETLSVNAVQPGVTLQICLSSRHFPYVSMKKKVELVVEERDEHGGDITLYVAEKLRAGDGDMKAQVQKRADGIFMWVVIVVALLNRDEDGGRVEDMQKTLDKLPDDIEGVFHALLSKADQHKAETTRMLQWVLLSQRPLKPEELFFAVVQGTTPAFAGPWDRSKVTMDIIQKRITTSSKGLIEIRKGDATSVQFIHLSVNDFLLRNRRLQKLDQALEPDPISASHGRLWACCWSCIKQQNTTLTSEQLMKRSNEDYPFLGYAASHIFDHAEKALSGGVMQEAIEQWLGEHDGWFLWWKSFIKTTRSFDEYFYLENNIDGGLLYTLSFRGYLNLVRILLEQGADMNVQGGDFGTALQAASYKGHEAIVKLLLGQDADVNVQGGIFGTALQAASFKGHEAIVKLLLGQGADVNVQRGDYSTALQAASSEGHEAIVKLLLGQDADVNIQGRRFGTALQAASSQGYEAIVKLLLGQGADMNIQGRDFGTALQAASYEGHEAIVKLLLGQGADVNVQGERFGTALQAASSSGYEAIVKLLLGQGADVNVQGGDFGTALQAASYKGHEAILRMSRCTFL